MDLIDSGGSGKPKSEKAPAATEAQTIQLSTSVEDEIDGVNFEHQQIRCFRDFSVEERLQICRNSPRFFEHRASLAVEELDPGERVTSLHFVEHEDSIDREWAAREVLAALPKSRFYFPLIDLDEPLAFTPPKLRKAS